MEAVKNKIPTLRFPEFSEGWEEFKLEKKYILISGQHLNPDEYSIKKQIGLSPYFTGPSDFTNGMEDITKWSLKKGKVANKGDILFTVKGSGVGSAMLLMLDEVTMGRQLMAISSSDSSTEFLHHKLALYKNYYIALASGNMIPGLSRNDILTTKIDFPTLPEQKKIATFLTAIDSKIEQVTKKKQLLEQYKKGVMQQIFSQQLRFKDKNGNDFPDWEEKKLGDFLIPCIREVEKPKIKYLAIGIRSHCKGTFQKPNADPTKIAMDRLFIVKENDVIVNITFAWEGAIALVKKEDDGGLVSHRFPTYTFNSDLVLYHYFKYIFIQKEFRFMLGMISPGGAGRNRVMSKKDFLKLKCEVPSIEEQTQIANFLSAIDTKIELANTELEKTQEFKKGLLQQMFV